MAQRAHVAITLITYCVKFCLLGSTQDLQLNSRAHEPRAKDSECEQRHSSITGP